MCLFSIFLIVSCGENNDSVVNQKALAELENCKAVNAEEQTTREFMENYIRDLNSPDWRSKLPKYLQPNPEAFLEEHAAFRKSFPNYKSTIKHLTVDGNEGIVWLNVKGNYAKNFGFESQTDAYGDNILNGIDAENQALSWDETWQFNVVDGKFGEDWDFLKDNYKVLQDLKATESE